MRSLDRGLRAGYEMRRLPTWPEARPAMSVRRLFRQGKKRRYVGFHKNVMTKEAIEEYLYRPDRINHDFIKDVGYNKLLGMLEPDFEFHTEPRLHQLQCLMLAIDYSGFCFWVDMGGGKTKIMLDAIRYRRQYRGMGKVLVVVPYPVTTLVWEDEAAKHAPDLRVVSLVGTYDERKEKLATDADVYVINYLGLFVMTCDLVKRLTPEEVKENRRRELAGAPKRLQNRTGRKINKSKLASFSKQFDCIIYDEGQFIGGHDTTQFKLCRAMSTAAKYSYVLTGTPFGRDPAPVWSQFFCADLGVTFGDKYGTFRSAFYDAKVNPFGTEYKFNTAMEKDLKRIMRNRCIRYEDVEFANLPPITYQTLHVHMTSEMKPYYAQNRKQFIDLQRGQKVDLLKSKYHQLRGITSGFLVGEVGQGDDVVRVQRTFADNPKADALRGLVESLPYDRKITIFHEYVATGDMLVALCRKLKIKCTRIGGGHDGAAALKSFLHDADCRILIAQSKAGGVALNLQICNHFVYYETPTSPVTRKQSEKRGHREGQTRPVFVYDLVMNETLDADIQVALKSGIDFVERLLRPDNERPRMPARRSRDASTVATANPYR